jgi:hypothetical protein
MCFTNKKKVLTRIGVPGYIIKHIYKTTPALSWNIPIFGGFFPIRPNVPGKGGRRPEKHKERGAITAQ